MQPCSLRSAERPSTSILNPFRFITYICFLERFIHVCFFLRCRTRRSELPEEAAGAGLGSLALALGRGGSSRPLSALHGRAAARRGTVDFGVAGEVSQRLDPERSLASR